MAKEEELIKIIKDLNATNGEIENASGLLNSIGHHERYRISKEIVSKLTTLISDTLKARDLISKYATLRYIFETLINVRLLNKEEKLTYIFYYSIYKAQFDKVKKLLSRISDEIELARKYEQLEKTEPNESDLQKHYDLIDSEAAYEPVIFWGDYKNYGYSYIVKILESTVRPKYEIRLKDMRNNLDAVKTKLFKTQAVSDLFTFASEDDVSEKLVDKRKWQVKAKEAGLEKDYNLIYDISSSLLHATSYSLFTSQEFEQSDEDFVNTLITRYGRNIIKELEEYLGLRGLKKIVLIE